MDKIANLPDIYAEASKTQWQLVKEMLENNADNPLYIIGTIRELAIGDGYGSDLDIRRIAEVACEYPNPRCISYALNTLSSMDNPSATQDSAAKIVEFILDASNDYINSFNDDVLDIIERAFQKIQDKNIVSKCADNLALKIQEAKGVYIGDAVLNDHDDNGQPPIIEGECSPFI